MAPILVWCSPAYYIQGKGAASFKLIVQYALRHWRKEMDQMNGDR